MKQIKMNVGKKSTGDSVITDKEAAFLSTELSKKKYNPIPKELEYELIKKAKNGCVNSCNLVIHANMRFCFAVAKKYYHSTLSQSDLFAEGVRGMIKAIYCFDETKGCKFISYAVWWIKQRIQIFIEKTDKFIRVPNCIIDHASTVQKISDKIAKNTCDFVPVDVACEISGISKSQTNTLIEFTQFKNIRYFSSMMSNYDDRVVEETIEGEKNAETELFEPKKLLMCYLEKYLSLQEMQVIIHLFGLNGVQLTLKDVMERLNLTAFQIYGFRDSAFEKIRKIKGLAHLKDYIYQN